MSFSPGSSSNLLFTSIAWIRNCFKSRVWAAFAKPTPPAKKNGFSLNSNNAVFFAKSYIRSKEYAQRIHNILEVAIFAVDLSYITVENYNSYYNPNSRELRSREVIPADKIIGIHSI